MHSKTEVQEIINELCIKMKHLFPHDKIDAILFGSYAREDAGLESDVDVLLLVDASRQDIRERNWQVGEMAADLLMNYGIVVSPIVENRSFFHANIDALPFFSNINREGVRMSD